MFFYYRCGKIQDPPEVIITIRSLANVAQPSLESVWYDRGTEDWLAKSEKLCFMLRRIGESLIFLSSGLPLLLAAVLLYIWVITVYALLNRRTWYCKTVSTVNL